MEWNRRDFMVGPIVMAGTASVLGRTDSLLTKLLGDSSPLIQRMLGKTGLTMPVVSMGVMNEDIPGLCAGRTNLESGISIPLRDIRVDVTKRWSVL